MNRWRKPLLHGGPMAVLAAALVVASCAGPAARRESADATGAAGGLASASVPAGPFELAVWQRPVQASALTIYIEGDGLAWLDRSTPSPDPTPRDAMAVRLAALDPTPAVAALARPCQFRSASPHPQPLCDDPQWWTSRRFTQPSLNALDRAVDALKRRANADKVHLVGFSGGGALAALLAARRDDVLSLRTVAGNLAPYHTDRLHKVDTPPGVLSPLDDAAKLARLPQIHFTGLQDKVTPPVIAETYAQAVRAAGGEKCLRIERVEAEHVRGWAERWATLSATALPDCRGGLLPR